ncbi:hypothetical protein [Methylocystis sp.]|uniref:hypothetical protein n=1 Tax=Methylocystis sp. TaxID=1911079 RepID=UPI0025F978FB|nr:hypothetical protein [Methylocystis sp.]
MAQIQQFVASPTTTTQPRHTGDDRYRLTRLRNLANAASDAAPAHWREAAAERWLRRKGSPGPASEHVFQYRLSAKNSKRAPATAAEALVTKAADLFYERQYRQFLNATMGVFAMTAKLALLGCGGRPKGRLWSRHRPVHAAMVEEAEGASPIIVLDHQTIAVPLFLPMPATPEEIVAIDRWLAGDGQMPPSYRQLVEGNIVSCATPYARALRRAAVGALIEVVDAVRNAGKLAVLALHPYDPDAMGLHLTLFGTEALTIETVQHDYAMDADTLYPWRYAAWSQNCLLRFCVGGVEEAFTQCSQNLFVKRPAEAAAVGHGAARRSNWSPVQPLDQLVASQFELFQVTASSSGLPGASPRNGDIGKAAFIARRGKKTRLLVPYFSGNAVHGHAAKLWSNPRGAIVIWDDHTALSSITITGPSRVVEHSWVARHFPNIAKEMAIRRKRNGSPASDPEYWFEQEVAEIIQQDEPLAQNILDPVRWTCSIHAAGLALHGKKPAYFAADSLPLYDQAWQHEREAEGRPKDPSGASRSYWEWDCWDALVARRAHLERSPSQLDRS